MKYTDIRRLEKILEYTEKLRDYIFGTKLEKQKLIEDYTIQWAVTTPFYNIGEHVYYLSSELKEQIAKILTDGENPKNDEE